VRECIDVSFQGVKFAKCPAEDLPEVSSKYAVSAVPTFLLLRGGSLLDRVDGANAAELTKKINLQVSTGWHNALRS
jgi:thioredoxin-like negative regulator of GroEL